MGISIKIISAYSKEGTVMLAAKTWEKHIDSVMLNIKMKKDCFWRFLLPLKGPYLPLKDSVPNSA